MKTICALLLSVLWIGQVAVAAPNYPPEGLLPRAETVFIGNVAKQDGKSVNFIVAERLRGEDRNEFTFDFVGIASDSRLEPNSRYFIISQGDSYWGQPKPIITLGQGMEGQASYCGWIMFPIKSEDKRTYLEMVYSSASHKVATLEQAREIVKQVAYNPDVYGKGERQITG